MKKCSKCGFENVDAAVFCNQCGTKLSDEETRNQNEILDRETSYSKQVESDNAEHIEIIPDEKQTNSNEFNEEPVDMKNDDLKKKGIILVIGLVILCLVCMLIVHSCNSAQMNKLKEENETLKQELKTEKPIETIQATTPPASEPTKEPIVATEQPATAEKEFIRENYGYVDYKELARNPDSYKGKSLTYSGKVIQVIEGDTETQHRIAINGDYDSVVYVAYPKNMVTSRILEDDYVTVYGTSLGLYTYQSTMGGKITVPAMYLDRIEITQ